MHIFEPFDRYIMGIIFDNLLSVSWVKNIDMYGSVLGPHKFFGFFFFWGGGGGGGLPNFFYEICNFLLNRLPLFCKKE